MGVATGGMWGGGRVHQFEILGGYSPKKSRFLKKIFGIFAKTFGFSIIFKIKWTKSEEKPEFGGRWF